MLSHLRRAVVVSVLLVALCGLAYPLAATGLAQALFGHQANGSLTADGSSLVGQKWAGPLWFQGRPDPYTPKATGGANLGPRSKALAQASAEAGAQLRAEGIAPTSDLVTTSFDGADPDISPAAAYAQVDAVARARHLRATELRRLVAAHVHARQLGFLGSPYVNVLELNEALARLAGAG